MKFPKYITYIALIVVFLFAAFVAVSPVGALQSDPEPGFDWGVISQALQTLALATIPALGAMIARWLNSKYQLERSRLTESQMYMLDGFIRTAVYAAEQMKVFDWADSKLDYATALVEEWLYRHNITMDVDEIRARIEAEVKQNFPKPPPVEG